MKIDEKWKIFDGTYSCPICDKKFSKMGIISHINFKHIKPSPFIEYLEKIRSGETKHWAKGQTKETNKSLQKQSETAKINYKNGLVIPPFTGKHHSKETKEIMRRKRFEYLKNHPAWNNKGTLSYGENWLHNIFLENKIYEKYIIINEYPIYPYFIDFSFINEKVAVEYDGEVHFKNGKERYEHDIKRDEYLKTKGWRVYRIPYYEMKNFKIEDLLNFIGNPIKNENINKIDYLMKYKEYKKLQDEKERLKKELKKELIEKTKQENIKILREKILNSNIDFSKFGWVNKVSIIINCKFQHVNSWMKKHMLDFYNEKCFKRKNSSTP
jgi:very-short-patch-repair endonuclease